MLKRREFLRLGTMTGLGLLSGCHQSTPSLTPSPVAEEAVGQEFIVRNRRPKDLETPVEAFQTYLTPNDRFFVRSHHPEPKVSGQDWVLMVRVPGTEGLLLDYQSLKSLEAVSVTAVLQCAGNSRGMYRPRVPGVQWGRGAVGNAVWRGARLADVLKKAGVDESAPEHVVIHGSDKPLMKTVPIFARQLPLSKCLHPDTLLAYEMNGEPLPRLHGGPVRLVVPGWVGDDWIKWVSSIQLQDEECEEFYYKKGYRYPDIPCRPGEGVDSSHMKPMTELVTRSLFSSPTQGAAVSMGSEVALKGVAWTGGDKLIEKVEISDDEGQSWHQVALEGEAKPYAWRLWSFPWKPKAPGVVSLRCRATDSSGSVQPLEDSPWNPGGYLWKTADKLEVEVTA